MDELVSKARKFATQAHRRIDQRRKYTHQPYEVHLKAVAQIVSSVSDDPEMAAAAWLHDVVEDTPATLDEIGAAFGAGVAGLVRELTDVSQPGDGNRAVRKAMDRAHLARASARGQTVKLADLIDNCQDICREDPRFARVFCDEMAALLAVLNKGNARLLQRAKKVLKQCRSRLDQAPPARRPADRLSPFERHSIALHQRALQMFARTFIAADIAEPLRSFDAVRPADEVKQIMTDHGLTVAGVRKLGKVIGYISRDSLGGQACGDHLKELQPSQVLNTEASLMEVVHVLRIHDYGFITALGEIVGIIGRGDMHKPVVRMWLFGIISFMEIQYTDQVRLLWPDNTWTALLTPARLKQAQALQTERQRRKQACELLDCLQFGDKLRILMSDKQLLNNFGFRTAGAAKRIIKDLESLRNNLAHGQDIISHDWPQIIRMTHQMALMVKAAESRGNTGWREGDDSQESI